MITALHSGRGARHAARLCFKFLVFAYFFFALLFLFLRFVALPNVERYKPEIEQYASTQLKRQVKLASLQAEWRGWHPEINIKEFRILNDQGIADLSLPEIHTQISWWSLFVFDLRFSRIEIVSPHLQIARNSAGLIEVAGFRIDPKGGSGSNEHIIEWLLAQSELSINGGSISWDDRLSGLPLIELKDLHLRVQNQWRTHQFALQATPPSQMAAPLDIRGSLKQSVFAKKRLDLASWSGEMYADLKAADIPAIHRYFPFPIKLDKGLGALRCWLRIEAGHLSDFTADVQLFDVFGRFRRDLPELDMASVSGRIIASERVIKDYPYLPNIFGQTGHSLAVENLTMKTRSGLVLPATSLRETYIPASKGQAEKVEIHAKSLDLHSLANFAEHLPIPADQRQILIDVAPKGLLRDFTASWQGTFPEISTYRIEGEFIELQMRPLKAQLARPKIGKQPAKAGFPATPGFDNVSGRISANEKSGRLTLDSKALHLQLPSYFVDPDMPFDSLRMNAKWELQNNEDFRFEIQDLSFEQNGATAHLHGSHHRNMRQVDLGEVDLNGDLTGFDVKTIARFIPEKAPEHLRHWLANALLEGKANNVSLRLKGRLQDFPFTSLDSKQKSTGEFVVRGSIADGKLNFLPGVMSKDGVSPFWPVIDNIKGSFVFDKARMEIRAETAQTNQVPLSKVLAVIPDLASHESILVIDGNAVGSLQTMFNYVKASPVDDWIGNFLHDSSANGAAQLALKLQLPLHSIIDSKVNGVLTLNANDTVLQPGLPLITGLTGKLDFNERGLNLNTLKANALGGPLTATGGTQKDGVIRIKLDGLATSDGIQKHFEGADFSPLLERLSGNSRYLAQINVKRRQLELQVDSNLQGFGIDFPAPFNKNPTEHLPLHFEMQPDASGELSETRDTIRLSAGELLQAVYQRKRLTDRNAKFQVLRGAVAVNATPSLAEDGLSLQVESKNLNLDDWKNLVSTPNKLNLVADNNAVLNSEMMQYIFPNRVSLVTDELQIFGKKIEKIVLGGSRSGKLWQANVESKQASGSIEWIPPNEKHQNGLISAKLGRLYIPRSAAADVSELLQAKNTTKQLPALEIHADQFELLGKKFGRADLSASNTVTPEGREWNIDRLHLKNEDAELNATGKWTAIKDLSQTQLNYSLDISNAGKLLDRLGFVDFLRSGKGKLEGDLRWTGLPFELDLPSLSGKLELKLNAGQFLKVDGGVAKLIGVLNMQSLPRRLFLDFRDVFAEGFAFDTVNGTANIVNGVATTDNFKMSSVSATVLAEGSANIVKETQDLHVARIANLNFGAASVVYGLIANPAIGVSTFLAQLLFKDPLKRAATEELKITGTWQNPVVTELENKERQTILEKQKADKLKTEQSKKESNLPNPEHVSEK
ncbi:TIGR02099 family protein [Undibacterium sp. LX40W]|uniref:TIGR02099 family protein n=1 Tax=Undibacterium nitidum TaxID=2762298 RepID=A0A923HN42_9BURK|nr:MULTISPECIES: YhdP family protein [Undibacterium]MBC3880130.1 TIGR02099 family protein [Undibacterium nitidum]MBC3891134.1 TIGR02099 family protein [Undibacterium sp. LX40W]